MLHDRMLAQPDQPGVERQQGGGLALEETISILRGESLALQSLVYGLCVSLAQMSEVHREVVIQALELADRNSLGARLNGGTPVTLRAAILEHIRSPRY